VTHDLRAELRNALLLLSACAVFVGGNIVMPSMFWRMVGERWLENTAMFFSGILVSEVTSLGVWTALSRLPWTYRGLLGAVMCAVFVSCFIVGMRIPAEPLVNAPIPRDVVFFLYGCAYAGWLASCCLLAWFRRYRGWKIHEGQDETESKPTQVTLAYLLALVTGSAGLVVLWRSTWPDAGPLLSADQLRAALESGVLAVYTLLLLVACVRLVLRGRDRRAAFIALLAVPIALGPLTLGCLALFDRDALHSQSSIFLYFYSFGVVSSTIPVLVCLRASEAVWRRVDGVPGKSPD
jgi:hypothetical protein